MDEQLVRELALPVVVAVAPGEEEVFSSLSDAYFADPERALTGRDKSDNKVSFDRATVVAVMVTPIALAAMTEVVKHIVGKTMAKTGPATARALRRLFGLAKAPDDDGAVLVLTAADWSEVHGLVVEKALAAGADATMALLIADAVVGRGHLDGQPS